MVAASIFYSKFIALANYIAFNKNKSIVISADFNI